MSDYRDLPIQVARRAAERNRASAVRRERWRSLLRATAWVLGVAGIVVVTMLSQPLWQPYIGGRQPQDDARAKVVRVEREPAAPDNAAAAGDDRDGRASEPTAPAVATASNAESAADATAERRAKPTPASAPPVREAAPAQPPDVAAEAAVADEPDARTPAAAAGESETEELETLRDDADEALRLGRLEQAAEGYRAVLERDADDEAAGQRLADVAVAHAVRAKRLAADFEFDAAERELAVARELAPDADAIREASRDLAQARALRARMPSTSGAAQQERVRSLLAEANAAMARGELMDPPGESAFDKIAAARALAPYAPEVRSATERLERARRTHGDRPATPR